MKNLQLMLLYLIQVIHGDWIRIQGDDIGNQPSSVEGDSIVPGARTFSASWQDNAGSVWLYGGYGIDVEYTLYPQVLGDLWLYNTTGNNWIQPVVKTPVNAKLVNPDGQVSARMVPKARAGSVACGVPDVMFVIYGGVDNNNMPLFDTWFYDIDVNVWIPLHIHKGTPVDHPPARSFATFWCLHDLIVVFGGIGKYGVTLNDLWVFSLKDLLWQKKSGPVQASSVPSPRAYAMSWTLESNLYLYGGISQPDLLKMQITDVDNFMTDMWVLNITNMNWTSLVPLIDGNKPVPRLGSFYWVEDLTVKMFGGLGVALNTTSVALNDMWIYDVTENKWSERIMINSGAFDDTKQENSNYRYALPKAKCCGASWQEKYVYYSFGGFGYDLRNDYVYLNDVFVENNSSEYISQFLPNKLTHVQNMLKELSPKLIFMICLLSVFSVACIFFVFLVMRKMVRFYPRHENTTVRYMPINTTQDDGNLNHNGLTHEVDLEMESI